MYNCPSSRHGSRTPRYAPVLLVTPLTCVPSPGYRGNMWIEMWPLVPPGLSATRSPGVSSNCEYHYVCLAGRSGEQWSRVSWVKVPGESAEGGKTENERDIEEIAKLS
ncbi:hypothetical protein PoB_002011000 [Plakobranchus ocellatus]|uniref:Ig-like domain-containing protein n=1 Tax=Plakobranchus ocellatus TaxID=259542 RepID=A0AAV3ZDB4_9GAST|nr:hypothetical protein PoB_002011000 [Plakobranchus ocellatus]